MPHPLQRFAGRGPLVRYALATTAFTVLFAALILVQHRVQGTPTPWHRALAWALPACASWALLYPPILRIAGSSTPERIGWPQALLVHLPLAAAFAAAYVLLRSAADLVFPVLARTEVVPAIVLRHHFRRSFGVAVLAYGATAALGWALEYRWRYRRSHERWRSLEERLAPPTAEVAEPPPGFVVRIPSRTFTVAVDDVDWIEAERNYVALHVGGQIHLVRETMKSVEERLAALHFVRIHRSTIVNTRRVRELRPSRGDWVAVLESRVELRTTPGGRARLAELLEAGGAAGHKQVSHRATEGTTG